MHQQMRDLTEAEVLQGCQHSDYEKLIALWFWQ
jgi:hypothetical protein